MAFLTLDLLRKIKAIIAKYHAAMIHRVIGASALTKEELEIVTRAGLVDPSLGIVRNSYLYGHALAREPTKETAEMSSEAFETLRDETPLSLSEPEQRAVIYAEERAAETIRGLGNRIAATTGEVLIEADRKLRAETEEMIRDKTAQAIAERKTARELKLDLGHASKDWARDWDRIAVTEQHTAHQQGLADSYRAAHGDDEWVFKRPRADACAQCKALHLGPDGAPRIFRLSKLYEAGATNAGRKRAEWRAVVGSTHPFCQCQLGRVPRGWGFNSKGTLVPGGEFGVRDDGEDEPIALSLTRPRERFVIRAPVEKTRLEPLFKGTEAEPGAIHTWRDGNQYQKGGDGRWRPVGQDKHAGIHDNHAEGAKVHVGEAQYTVHEHHHGHDTLTLRHDETGETITARIEQLARRGLRSALAPAHADRVDLMGDDWREKVPLLKTFQTQALARAYATSIGWPKRSARQIVPAYMKSLGLGSWVLADGGTQSTALTHKAAGAIEALPEGERPPHAELPRVTRTARAPRRHELPRRGGAPAAVKVLEGAIADLGRVDPGAGDGLQGHLEASELYKPADLKGLAAALAKDPAAGVREAIRLAVLRSGAKTWDELGDSDAFRNLTEFPGLEPLAAARPIARAVEERDYNAELERYADEHDEPEPEPEPEAVEEERDRPRTYAELARVFDEADKGAWHDVLRAGHALIAAQTLPGLFNDKVPEGRVLGGRAKEELEDLFKERNDHLRGYYGAENDHTPLEIWEQKVVGGEHLLQKLESFAASADAPPWAPEQLEKLRQGVNDLKGQRWIFEEIENALPEHKASASGFMSASQLLQAWLSKRGDMALPAPGAAPEPVPEEVPEDLPPEEEPAPVDPDEGYDERPIEEGEALPVDDDDIFKGSLSPELGAAHSPAGDRAVHTGSSGLNVMLEIKPPERKGGSVNDEGGYSPDYTDLKDWVTSQTGFHFGTKRSREDYELLDEPFRVVRPVVAPPERFEASREVASHASENREHIEAKQEIRANVYRNDAPTVKQAKRKRRRKIVAALLPPNETGT